MAPWVGVAPSVPQVTQESITDSKNLSLDSHTPLTIIPRPRIPEQRDYIKLFPESTKNPAQVYSDLRAGFAQSDGYQQFLFYNVLPVVKPQLESAPVRSRQPYALGVQPCEQHARQQASHALHASLHESSQALACA